MAHRPKSPPRLADVLCTETDAIVQRWLDEWQHATGSHEGLSEAALKDLLPAQLELIGEQLRDLKRAEKTGEMWSVAERLDPEKRVNEDIPIEEVVQEYRLAVEVVRNWIAEHSIEVPFEEYSYFFNAIFELAAESVRRYAKHQAERVAHQRQEYLAGLMHELRTPLSVVSLNVDELARRRGLRDSAVLRRLKRNARRIRALVEGVIRLERFRPDELPVHPCDVNIEEFLDGWVVDLSHDASRKGLRFEARVDPKLVMHVDPDLLGDAIGNLLQNAVKLTDTGFVIVEARDDGDAVVFQVRDSGPGIAPDKLESLFKSRQEGTAGGLGIGLQIAARAASALGGTIDAESAVGHGSIFRVRIPKHAEERGEAPRQAPRPPGA